MRTFKILLVTGFLLQSSIVQCSIDLGSKDTIFYDYSQGIFFATYKYFSNGYSLRESFNDSVYLQKVYSLERGYLLAEFEQFDVRIEKSNSNDFYSKKNGSYTEYYESGKKKVSCNFLNNEFDGEFFVYYPNEKIKRHDIWKEGVFVYGECYDEEGNKVDFFPYFEMAQFEGGESGVNNFIVKNVKYPKKARRKNIQGKVYVQFMVDDKGKVRDSKVIRGVDPLLDAEALRVITMLPNWKPAKLQGVEISMILTIPINYTLVD